MSSVITGHKSWLGSMYSDFTPKDSKTDENTLMLVLSPMDKISANCFSVTSFPMDSSAIATKSSVVLLIADTTTTTFFPSIYAFTIDCAAFLILCPFPIEVPPNLATINSICLHTFSFKLKIKINILINHIL